MALVEYSDSDSDEEPSQALQEPQTKRRKLESNATTASSLPPLPASFLDQYSSTVRTSTRDDPSLHAGRKRVTPHVEGNWPTHIYLEWHPSSTESELISGIVSNIAKDASAPQDAESSEDGIHSLLQNDLGVATPLHISLSRPLTLKTEQKDAFLAKLTSALSESSVRAFELRVKDLAWHGNESSTRWFLVMRLHAPAADELQSMLTLCNGVARSFRQPVLYGSDKAKKAERGEKFHISIAWALKPPSSGGTRKPGDSDGKSQLRPPKLNEELMSKLVQVTVPIGEVKIRVGQGVHVLPLKSSRQKEKSSPLT